MTLKSRINRNRLSKLAFVAAFTSLIVSSRIIMVNLPNIKLVAFFVITGGIIAGPLSGFVLGALSMIVSDVAFFGAGFWTIITSISMGTLGLIGGKLWHKRKREPSRLELGVVSYIITLAYDIVTSIITIPIILSIMQDSPAVVTLIIFSAITGLFVPLGSFLWPAGPAHEFSTAFLAAIIIPILMKIINGEKQNESK